ncbi:MAG: Wzz/FepE/Etk N-terminal domain-containing protein [Candidatus Acidiferrales bacterium]
MTNTLNKKGEKVAGLSDISGALRTPDDLELGHGRGNQVKRLRPLWEHRRLVFQASAGGLIVATLIAFLISKHYTSTARLMPPDSQSTSNMMMLAGLAEKAGNGIGAMAGDLLGLKSSGALFVGMLQSQTIQDRLVEQFDLKKEYRTKLLEEAREELNQNTSIQEDRKSGIISIAVTDESPQRAAALANAYVNELNWMVSHLSTSSAHRERVFLEGRLQSVKVDLEDAEEQLALFSSNNNTLDMQQQGKAMLEAAATLAGQMITAQSELEGLRQIYTDSNPRVRSLNARVKELRKELDKLGGIDGQPVNAAGRDADPPVADRPSDLRVAGLLPGMPYPSIRELPLLGAKYADYYRRAKTEETVSELLTEQYELAKVEEAKETPSVQELDPAHVPERKSFPPRLLMMCLGTAAGFVSASIWVLSQARWVQTAANDPRKVFAAEVFETVKVSLPWAATNGEESKNVGQRVWNRLRRTDEKQAD